MNVKTLILSGMTALSIAAPMMAHADPGGWRGGDRGYHGAWRGGDRDGWRDHDGWRGYGWRAGWAAPWSWGYAPRCWVENRRVYGPYGEYFVRPIRVCR